VRKPLNEVVRDLQELDAGAPRVTAIIKAGQAECNLMQMQGQMYVTRFTVASEAELWGRQESQSWNFAKSARQPTPRQSGSISGANLANISHSCLATTIIAIFPGLGRRIGPQTLAAN
jgi:hypothetical protein